MEKLTGASFEFLEIVGNGAFGRVIRARKKDTSDIYAIKVIEKRLLMREGKAKQAHTEKNVLARLRGHSGVVRLHYAFQDETNLYFVLEYCPGGDLASLIHRLGDSFPYPLAVLYCAEVVSMLEFLHARNIVHRDLKPENLLLTSHRHLKLTDFGTALDHTDLSLNTDSHFVGTAEYVSPEVIRGESACFSSDLWALGCILYHMLVGRPPFKAANEYLTFEQIRALDVAYPESLPAQAVDLIRRLLVSEPSQRLGACSEASAIDYSPLKEHPFFTGIDFNTVFEAAVPEVILPAETSLEAEHDLELQLLNKSDLPASPTVILSDIVKKKAGWVYKSRQLTVTTEPKIRYFDPSTNEQKGEIQVTSELEVVLKSRQEFQIVLPKRTYYFKDLSENSSRWETAIRQAKQAIGR